MKDLAKNSNAERLWSCRIVISQSDQLLTGAYKMPTNTIKIEKNASKVKASLSKSGKSGKQAQIDHQLGIVSSAWHFHEYNDTTLLTHAVMSAPRNWRRDLTRWIGEQMGLVWAPDLSVFKVKTVSTFRTDPFDAQHLADLATNAWFNVSEKDAKEMPEWLLEKLLGQTLAKIQKNSDDAESQINSPSVQKIAKELSNELATLKKRALQDAKKAA